MASESEERAVRTQLLHREVNERIRHVAGELFDLGARERLWIVCECLRLGCSERLELPADVYERVRASPTRFVVVAGHEDPQGERVVEEHPGYVVVEKQAAIVGRLPEGTRAERGNVETDADSLRDGAGEG